MAAKGFDYTSMGFITVDCLGWPFTAIPPGGAEGFIDPARLEHEKGGARSGKQGVVRSAMKLIRPHVLFTDELAAERLIEP